jgi:hypothetical protein
MKAAHETDWGDDEVKIQPFGVLPLDMRIIHILPHALAGLRYQIPQKHADESPSIATLT